MQRMKTFFIYALLVALVVLCSDFIINICLTSTYKQITKYEIGSASPQIVILDAARTYVNGYVCGKIKNNTEEDIEKTYIKVELLSKRGNLLGTEYMEVDSLKKDEQKDFKLEFRYNNVDNFVIGIEKEIQNKNVKINPLMEKTENYLQFAKFIMWSFVPPIFLISAMF